MRTLILTICVGLLIVLAVGLAVENWQLKHAGVVYIPSLPELQQIVGAEPDGIYGPETKEKWDLYFGQQSADVHINKDTMK